MNLFVTIARTIHEISERNKARDAVLADAATTIRRLRDDQARILALVATIKADPSCETCSGGGRKEVWIHDEPHDYPCECTYPKNLLTRADV